MATNRYNVRLCLRTFRRIGGIELEEDIKILERMRDNVNGEIQFEDDYQVRELEQKQFDALNLAINHLRKTKLIHSNYIPICETAEKFEELFGNTPFENIEKIKNHIKDNYVSKDKIREKIKYYVGMYEIGKLHTDEASKHQMQAILLIIEDLQELLEE